MSPRGEPQIASWLVGIGFALVALGWWLELANSTRRLPTGTWGLDDATLLVLTAASSVTALAGGGFLVSRLRGNPTGKWVIAGGVASAAATVGRYWPSPVGLWLEMAMPSIATASLVVAVLRWPTGRLEPRWAGVVSTAILAYVGVSLIQPFFAVVSPWPDVESPSLAFGLLSRTVAAIVVAGVLSAVAPAVFMAALTRRRSMLPRSLRISSRSVLVGAVVLAGTEIWTFVADGILSPYGNVRARPTPIGLLRSFLDVARFGLVALVIVASELGRRRRADHEPAPGTIELEPVDVATMQGSEIGTDLAVLRERRRVEAERATAQVAALQRRLLAAQDKARRILEHDLHDAVQQRLVALALQASLAARSEAAGGSRAAAPRDEVLAGIEEAIDLVHELVEGGRPALIDDGLVSGLQALAATAPLPISVDAVGDLSGADDRAVLLWYMASEAVSNALKHAQATRIAIRLEVGGDEVMLSVSDDGRGGLAAPPPSLSTRLASVPAQLSVSPSETGFGTKLTVVMTSPVMTSPMSVAPALP
jgi:signal transduction histidine kinase